MVLGDQNILQLQKPHTPEYVDEAKFHLWKIDFASYM